MNSKWDNEELKEMIKKKEISSSSILELI